MKRLILLTAMFLLPVFSAFGATYYSVATGDANLLTNWNTIRDGSGIAPGNYVTTGDIFVVQNGHTMTDTAVWTIGVAGSTGKLQIENGGVVKADFQVVLFSTMTFQIDAGGKYIHNNTSSMASGIFAGTESLDTASIFEYQNVAATPARPGGGYGNLIINFPAAATTNAGFASGTETIKGDFTVQSTGVANTATGQGSWRITNATNSNTIVNGNYIHNGGVLIVCVTSACNNTDAIGPQLSVNNFTLNGGIVIVNSSTTASPILQSYFQVNGNANLTAGTLSLVQTYGATAPNIGQVGEFRVKGNLNNSGAAITRPAGSSSSRIIFNGTTPQTFTMPAATPLGNSVSVSVYPGASVTLGSDLTQGTTAAQLDVLGTLNTAGFTVAINQLNIGCTGSSVTCPAFGQPPSPVNTGTFTLAGGTLNMNSGGTASITNWAVATNFSATNATINMNNSSLGDWINSGTVNITNTNLNVGGSSGPNIQINATGTFNVRGASNVKFGTNATSTESQMTIFSGGSFNWTDAGSRPGLSDGIGNSFVTSGTLTTGTGGVSNGGTITFNGTDSACNQADSILIRSSAPGVARPWTGAGRFFLADVDIQDQNSTPAINAISSTNSGNNTNFTFGACPVAAGVELSGRVTTLDGRGIKNVAVILTDSNGVGRIVRTGSFGYYRFEDVAVGETYIIGVASKQYQFQPRVIQVFDALADIDFIGSN